MRLTPLLAVLPLAACMTTMPDDARRVSYSCDRGTELNVIYAGDIARIENPGGPPINLQRIGSGSNVVYSSATRKLRGEGDEVTYAVGRAAPETCRVVTPAG